MKKLIIIIIALLVLSSCGVPQPKEVKVHEGSDGLVIEFERMAPPDTAFEGEALPITIKMANRGAYDITNGFYSISVEKAYMNLEGENIDTFSVNGKSPYDLEGGTLIIRRGVFAGELDPMTQTLSSTISVTACYPYQTTATANVCIDTDLFGQNPDKVCSANDISFPSGGQGAPIGITSIEPKMKQHPEDNTKIIPQFLIYIRNMGNGQAIEPSKTRDSCTGASIDPEFWNTAEVKVKLIDKQLDCTPKINPNSASLEGHIKFSRDASREDFIKCELKEGISRSLGTYTSALSIEIDYGYTTTISRTVQIKNG
jgi:hypothetical protein